MTKYSSSLMPIVLSALILLLAACSSMPKGEGDIQQGMASWYGKDFQGRKTASGERFDMHQLTAAHRTLPFGSRVLVTCKATGKSVYVRINDRGPYAKGRILDLSYEAARRLGVLQMGEAPILLKVDDRRPSNED